jgi:orotate phosphoribosyltransferase
VRAQVQQDLGIPVVTIVTLTQLIAFLEDRQPEEAKRLRQHQTEFGARR